MGNVTFTLADFDAEVSTASFPGSDLTVANITDEYADALALQAALDDVSLCFLLKRVHTAVAAPQGVGKAADENAQRESKALVKYFDSLTFRRGTLEIPGPDLEKQHPGKPGWFFHMGVSGEHAHWTAMVAAIEDYVVGPSGNAAVVEEVIHVGRRL